MPKTAKNQARVPNNLVTNVPKAIRTAEQSVVSAMRRLTSSANTLAATTGVSLGTSTVTTSAEWSNMSARYVEARVLAIRMTMIPNSSAGFPLIVATDRSGALSAPASSAVAFQMAGAKLFYIGATVGKCQVYTAKAQDLEDFEFDNVGSMTNRFAVTMYNASATGVGYYLEYIVEFRGSR